MIAPRPRPTRRVFRVLAALVAGLVATSVAVSCSTSTSPQDAPLVMGAGDGVAGAVVADIYRQVLRSTGAPVADDTTVGDYGRLLDDMTAGRVALFGAFDGALLARLAPSSTATSADDVYTDLNRALPQGVSVGDATTVSDQLQVVVPSAQASAAGVDELSECGRLPGGLALVGDREPDPTTMAALTAAGCRFAPYRRLGSVDEVIATVRSGRAAGLVSPLSSAGTAADLTALRTASPASDDGSGTSTPPSSAPGPSPSADPAAVRAQVLVPVYASGVLTRERITAINKVAGELTTADLATMAQRVAGRQATVSAVVGGWLAEHGF
ncbi:glycine betaine ABC transporter substrate-binding protein [Williamsia deligens]|uniref:Glycine betaine ABC transporter substrate-binding protein n=1 Tax=Williamsia deligens TaxID=321325 RepID=A0ABW3GA01_9NOCA|nr:glycine betaine ABC transporter substrate-binding protein [Williamsia deligens]MCP2196232.1 osmoprotectant transport system substrate-binding protein [Williamsia deligens]